MPQSKLWINVNKDGLIDCYEITELEEADAELNWEGSVAEMLTEYPEDNPVKIDISYEQVIRIERMLLMVKELLKAGTKY